MSQTTLTHKIQYELVKLLYQQIKLGLWAESVAAICLVIVLWGYLSSHLLIGWLLFNLLFCGLMRHVLLFCYQRFSNKTATNKNNIFFG